MKQKNIHNTTNFSVYKQIINSQTRKNFFEKKLMRHQLNLLKRRYQVLSKGKREIFMNLNDRLNIKKSKFGTKVSFKQEKKNEFSK